VEAEAVGAGAEPAAGAAGVAASVGSSRAA
jgi:hypothetical protein